MANFPSSIPAYAGFTSSHTLSQDNHAAQHNAEQGDITAIATKIGTGASTPTSGLLLRGSGAGTSAWSQVQASTDITGILGTGNGGTGQNSLSNLPLPSPVISGTVSGGATYISPILITPTIASFTNAQHTHQNAAGGGILNGALAIQANSLTSGQVDSSIAQILSGGNFKIQTGTVTTSNSADTTVTFSTAFNSTPVVFAQSQVSIGLGQVDSPSATSFKINNYSTGNARQALATSWVAIGT